MLLHRTSSLSLAGADDVAVPELLYAEQTQQVRDALMNALPSPLSAADYSAAMRFINQMAPQIVADSQGDPKLLDQYVQAATAEIRTRFQAAEETTKALREESAKRDKEDKKEHKASVKREEIQLVDEYGRPIDGLSDAHYELVRSRADDIFSLKDELPDGLEFTHMQGKGFWRFELGGGEFAMVPAEAMQMVNVSRMQAAGDMLSIQIDSAPILLGGTLQASRKTIEMKRDAIAEALGASFDTDQALQKELMNQQRMEDLMRFYHEQQERMNKALGLARDAGVKPLSQEEDDAQCVALGGSGAFEALDMPDQPTAFSPAYAPNVASSQPFMAL